MLSRIKLAGLMVLMPVLALAQDEPVPEPEPIAWLRYVAIAINAVLIPFLVDWLRPLWKGAPKFVKSVVPMLAGTFLPLAVTAFGQIFPIPIDLMALEQIWLGAMLGAGASTAYKFGDRTGISRHGGRK